MDVFIQACCVIVCLIAEVYELLFKQALHELDSITAIFSKVVSCSVQCGIDRPRRMMVMGHSWSMFGKSSSRSSLTHDGHGGC